MALSRRQLFKAAALSRFAPVGIFEKMVEQASTGEVFEHHVQDVEPILENNKRLMREAEETNGGKFSEGWGQRVASIPTIIVEKWLYEEGIDVLDKNDWPKVAAKLDSPEYLYLRTGPGRVSGRPVRSFPTTMGRKVKPQGGGKLIKIARA